MSRTPSLSSLRLFLKVAHTQNFSEAARLANLSQPALSRTIRLMEDDLGVRLFDRSSRKVALTGAGDMLLPTVERLIADFDHAFAALTKDLTGMRGRIVIGALPSFAAATLPQFIKGFIAISPSVEIVVRDEIAGTLYRQLRDGQTDLAFVTQPEASDFTFQPLLSDRCVLVFQAGSALDVPGPAPWSTVSDAPFVAMASRSSVRELSDAALAQAGIIVKPLYEVSQLVTMGGMIAAGLGLTVLPQSTIKMLANRAVAWRPLEAPMVERKIGLAQVGGRSLSPAAAAFRDYSLRLWQEMQG
jgi:LysR family carnitine catabolism transcriptional activator